MGDAINHPHVVLYPAGERRSTLVKGTTSPSDIERCPQLCHRVAPDASNGLRKTGWMQGPVLERTAGRYLRSPVGALTPTDFAAVRQVVAAALGVGTGVGLYPRDEMRGRIVRLNLPMAKPDVEWAVVLTELEYSAKQHRQVIVPLLDATGRMLSSATIFLPAQDLQLATDGALTQAFAAVELVQSLWQPRHVAATTKVTVQETLLDAIARAAMAFLGVP